MAKMTREEFIKATKAGGCGASRDLAERAWTHYLRKQKDKEQNSVFSPLAP